MSYGRMLTEEARLKEDIRRLSGNAGAVESEEDERYGEQMRGAGRPAELERREKRLTASRQATARLGGKLSGDEGRAQYAKRTWIPEAPNGWMRAEPIFGRVGLREVEKVQGEWHPVCMALNVRRMRERAAC